MFVTGMTLAMIFRRPLTETNRHVFRNGWFYACLAYGTVFGYGTAALCYILAPDWMWMYWMDARNVSAVVLADMSLVYILSLYAGLLSAVVMAKESRMLWTTFGGGCVGIVLIGIVWFPRVLYVGTRAEFEAGTAPPIIGLSPLHIHPLIPSMGIGVAIAMVVLWGMWRAARHTPTPTG